MTTDHLIVEECPPARHSIGHPRRRGSIGRSASMFLKRASSFTKIITRQQSVRTSFGKDRDDTCTDISEHSEHDEELVGLSKTIKENILKLKKCEAMIQKQIDSNLTLALARYAEGGNATGAILSMRKAHKNKTILACTVSARMQLVDIRQQINDALRHGQDVYTSVTDEQARVKRVLAKLQREQMHCPVLSDECAMEELKNYIMQVDVPSV